MRVLPILLAAALLLSGCHSTAQSPAAPVGVWGSGATVTPEARLARWEREWQASKRTVATARDDAVAAGAAIPPEVDRQVTDLLNRRIVGGPDPEARIDDLQDAVSDALRLAELLSIG